MPAENLGAFTISQFRRTYAVGNTKTYDLINSGAILAKKIGAKTVIDRASAEAWYHSLPGFSPARRIVKMRATMAAAP